MSDTGLKAPAFDSLEEAQMASAKQNTTCSTVREDGMPASAEERYLRRLLASRSGIPHLYRDDGEASGHSEGIDIDFMRDSAADLDAKLRAIAVARYVKELQSKEQNLSASV